MMHNQHLKETIIQAEQQVQEAKSDKDLIAAIHLFNEFPTPVKRSNTLLKTFYGYLILGCLSCAYQWFDPYRIELSLFMFLMAILLGYRCFFVIQTRDDDMDELTKKIHLKSSFFDHGLTEIAEKDQRHPYNLESEFSDFRRGDSKPYMPYYVQGEFKGEDNTFQFIHYQFTYAVSKNVSDGESNTRTEYSYYDRYGFIISFPYAKSIKISEKSNDIYSYQYKTSSLSFNKNFCVTCDKKLEAANFFVPSIIEAIEEMGKRRFQMTMEISEKGNLCLAYNDDDTLAINPLSSLRDPKKFANEIEAKSYQPKLYSTLQFLEEIIKYSDNNFAK